MYFRLKMMLVVICFTVVFTNAESAISSDIFSQPVAIHSLKLSPEGDQVAFAYFRDGKYHLLCKDLLTGKVNTVMGGLKDDKFHIGWFAWANNERLILQYYYYKGGFWSRGNHAELLAINADGTQPYHLKRSNGSRYSNPIKPGSIKNYLPKEKEYILVSLGGSLKKINIYKDERRDKGIYLQGIQYFFDRNNELRLYMRKKGGEKIFFYKESNDSEWQEIFTKQFMKDEFDYVGIMGFHEKENEVLLEAYNGKDTRGLYIFNLNKKEISKEVFHSNEYDIDSFMYDTLTKDIKYVSYIADKEQLIVLDDEYKALYKDLNKFLPNRINKINHCRDDFCVVYSYGDIYPGTFYLLNKKKNVLKKFAEQYKGLSPESLSAMLPIQYLSRDKKTIHGYITYPKNKQKKLVPLVVYPHGGPQARDEWGFDPMVQMLTNRGYAVLQVNFRGSTGYGKEHTSAGDQEWGLKIQNDITDGIMHVTNQGKVDKNKVCIMGWSYGGYSALIGITKTPDLYRCAIAGAGVSDLDDYISYAVNLKRLDKDTMDMKIGSRWKNSRKIDSASPIEYVENIKSPVLLIHGDRDIVVRARQSEIMAEALKKLKKQYKLVILEGANHQWQPKYKGQIFKEVDDFLAKHL